MYSIACIVIICCPEGLNHSSNEVKIVCARSLKKIYQCGNSQQLPSIFQVFSLNYC